MTSKVIEGNKSSSNFTVNQNLPLLDGPMMLHAPNCVDLSLSHSPSCSLFPSLYISLSISLFCSMQKIIYTQRNVFHKINYDLKGHVRPLLCRVIFKKFQIFGSNNNLDLHSYGQLLSLFSWQFQSDQRRIELMGIGICS